MVIYVISAFARTTIFNRENIIWKKPQQQQMKKKRKIGDALNCGF